MTARRSLVKSKLPTIASYEEVDPGTVTLGVVTAVRHFGTIVTFYNNVKGIVPAGTLGATEHTVGQTVKCKVLNTDPARQRMKLSFDLNADVSVVATTGGNTAAAVAGVAVGSVVAATVVGVLADRLNVELTESGARGSILASHLSDHACFFVPPQDPAAAADYTPITARFSKGDVLKKVLVVAKEGPTKNRLVLSMKPCLLQYAKELDTPVTELQDLVAGQTHMGYIRSTTSLGCFVGLVHGLVGLVSVQDLSERFIDDPAKHFASGQTVAIVVKSFNVEKNRAYFSLKGADELLQQYSPVCIYNVCVWVWGCGCVGVWMRGCGTCMLYVPSCLSAWLCLCVRVCFSVCLCECTCLSVCLLACVCVYTPLCMQRGTDDLPTPNVDFMHCALHSQ